MKLIPNYMKTTDQRSKNMAAIKCRDTQIEMTLRKALWHKGYRYRKNYTRLPGKPDIVLPRYHIAIFCDSEFFHGKDFEQLKQQLSKTENRDYWIAKIQRNIERDAEVERELKSLGWTIIRFWGKEILQNTNVCVQAVEEAVFRQKITEAEDFLTSDMKNE